MKVGLPPNEDGYEAMADAVDPTIFDLE